MMEIRDTFRGGHDAKIETPKGIKEGEVWEGGITLPIQLVDLGEVINFSSGVRSAARPKWISCVLCWTEHISDRQNRQNYQLFELQHILTLNRGKFGTGFGIRDNSTSWMTTYFFLDRPSKFGKDGHLINKYWRYHGNVQSQTQRQKHGQASKHIAYPPVPSKVAKA